MGLLQKRIKEITLDFNWRAECNAHMVLDIIEEMRQEFPTQQIILGIATKNCKKDELVEMRPITLKDENRFMKEWFEKWFGGEE